jgi:hypothetical protein
MLRVPFVVAVALFALVFVGSIVTATMAVFLVNSR